MDVGKLQEALNSNQSVVLGARCEITYSGRAESFLPEGDRVLLVKQDGTILIHQPKGSTPVNYMKEATHTFKNNVLTARNAQEELVVKLLKIHFLNTHTLEDGQSLQLQGTEKDMADMIMQKPIVIEEGFTPVSQEEQTKYGFIDVMGKDIKGQLVIVECKRYNADLAAVTQLRRYVEKMKKTLGVHSIRGMIAAPKISSNALRMLTDWGFEFKEVHPPKFFEKAAKDQKRLGEY